MKTSVPLYHHVKQQVLDQIQQGNYREGEAIPSEAELSRHFGVSRITIRQALGDLVSLGYLTRQQGKGTFVSRRQPSFAASRLTGFTEEFRGRGLDVEIRLVENGRIPCPASVALQLGIPEGTRIIALSRVAWVGGRPMFRDRSHLLIPPNATAESAARLSEQFNHVYGFFEQCGVKIAYGHQQIRAERAEAEDVEALDLHVGDPMLVVRRVTFDESGAAVECSEVRYPADRYEYEVNLVRESGSTGGTL